MTVAIASLGNILFLASLEGNVRELHCTYNYMYRISETILSRYCLQRCGDWVHI